MIIHLSRNVSEHRRVAKQRLLRLTNNIWVLGGSDGKESACNARDPVLIPGLERSPGKKNGNPVWHSCLEIPCSPYKFL